jgi:transposase
MARSASAEATRLHKCSFSFMANFANFTPSVYFMFRGRGGDLVKLVKFDGDGLCLFSKRLERRSSPGRKLRKRWFVRSESSDQYC